MNISMRKGRQIRTRSTDVSRDMMKYILGLLLCLCAITAHAAPPHVIFILVDDFGWGDPGSYGGAIATPNLDRLASEGVQFRQFYTASPICSASRCGFITGQFPSRWKITSYLQTREGNRACGQADYLDPDAPSWPRFFRTHGYATAHIGKWHLGGGRDVTDAPKFAAYGYDLGLGTYESPEPAAALGLKSTPWSLEREPQQVPRHERTRWMVDETLSYLKQNKDRPCMVNLWLDDTHTPFRPKEGKDDREIQAKFQEVLTETDRQVGRLLDGLREMGLDQNTLVILAGDNGPEPSFGAKRTGGLRGMKWSLYEGGIRTPLIARWPGVIPAGQVNEKTVLSGMDLLPTLAALTGLPQSDLTSSDGENLASAFKGKSPARTRPLFWEYGRAVTGATKGLRAFPYPKEAGARSPQLAIREGNWKLLMNADGSQIELYDLDKDSSETQNRKDAEPKIARQLQEKLLQWKASMPQ